MVTLSYRPHPCPSPSCVPFLLWQANKFERVASVTLRDAERKGGERLPPSLPKENSAGIHKYFISTFFFHFAAKCNPFCGKMFSVLRQNRTRFAAKCKSLWAKTLSGLAQINPEYRLFLTITSLSFGEGRGEALPNYYLFAVSDVQSRLCGHATFYALTVDGEPCCLGVVGGNAVDAH